MSSQFAGWRGNDVCASQSGQAGDRLADLAAQLRDPHLPAALADELPAPFRALLIALLATDPASRPAAAVVRGLLENASAMANLSE